MSVTRVSGVIGRRACASLAAVSAVLHAVMLGHAASPAAVAVMMVMIAGCLFCARDLWLRGTARAWLLVALMNLAMIASHVPAPAHHHGAAPAVAPMTTVSALATVLSAVEVAAAAVILGYTTRRRSLTGGPR